MMKGSVAYLKGTSRSPGTKLWSNLPPGYLCNRQNRGYREKNQGIELLLCIIIDELFSSNYISGEGPVEDRDDDP